MRGCGPICGALFAAVVAFSPAVAAGQTPRWSQPVEVAEGAFVGGADVDGRGAVTATFALEAGGVVAATRAADADAFAPPVRIAPAGAFNPRIEVNEPGEAIVLWSEPDGTDCPSSFGCGSLRARSRTRDGSFGPVDVISGGDAVGGAKLALNDGGGAAVVWRRRGEADSGPLAGTGPIAVSRREPGGGFGAEITLAEARGTTPALAIGQRGEIAVAWSQYTDSGVDVMVAHSSPGGGFGRPEVVWRAADSNNGLVPAVSIAPDGSVAVAWHTDRSYETMVSVRGPAGSFTAPQVLGPAGSPAFSLDAEGNQLLYWTSQRTFSSFPLLYETFTSLRERGASFAPPARAPIEEAFDTQMELDGAGNTVALWTPPERGQRLFAVTLPRFGPAEPVQQLSTGTTQLTDLSVNEPGAAVALYSVYPSRYPESGRARVELVQRAADRRAPRLDLGGLDLDGARLSVRARCSELCRVRIRGAEAARPSTSSRRRQLTRVLRARRRGRLTLVLSRRQRVRLGKALRSRGRARVSIRAMAEDPTGNRRVVRRKLSVRRGKR